MFVILFILAALLGVVTLAIAISRLIRLARDSVLLRAPLLAEQTLQFDQPASLLMNTEAPLSSAFQVPPAAFRGLEYSLRYTESGIELPLGHVLVGAATSSFRRTRIPIRKFQLERPAELTLVVEPGSRGEDRGLCPRLHAPLRSGHAAAHPDDHRRRHPVHRRNDIHDPFVVRSILT